MSIIFFRYRSKLNMTDVVEKNLTWVQNIDKHNIYDWVVIINLSIWKWCDIIWSMSYVLLRIAFSVAVSSNTIKRGFKCFFGFFFTYLFLKNNWRAIILLSHFKSNFVFLYFFGMFIFFYMLCICIVMLIIIIFNWTYGNL